MTKISIILPTYNSEHFLKDTINSVLNQDFSDWELIIVDDCSTDKTKDKILNFCKLDKRIKKIFLKKNSGSPALPHNIGFYFSKGKYICYLDHDDQWFPNKIKEQLKIFKKSPLINLGVVSCNAFIIDKLKNKKYYKRLKRYKSLKEVIYNPGDFICSNSSLMIKREVVLKVGKRDEYLGEFEDRDIIMRIANLGYNFDFVDEPLFNYFIHEKSLTIKNKKASIKKSLELASKYKYFINKYKNLFIKNKKIYSNHLSTLANFYAMGFSKKKSIKYFLEAIKRKPFSMVRYFYIIILLLNNSLYIKIYKLKNKFK